MKAFQVFLNGKWIDTVFMDDDMTAKDVKESLVNHDGYPSKIGVVSEYLLYKKGHRSTGEAPF